MKASAGQCPKSFALEGTVVCKAGPDAASPRKFFIVAYNGGKMRPAGFAYDVVVDLAGATFDKPSTIILADHDVSKRIGHSTKQAIIQAGHVQDGMSGPSIYLEGIVSSKSASAQDFIAESESGMPLQASIGANMGRARLIAADKTASANGQTFQGPFILVQQSRIRETSITALGADSSTSASLAATAGSISLEEYPVNFTAWLKSLGLDEASITAEQKVTLKAEFDRIQTLAAAAESPPPKKGKAKKADPVDLTASGDDDLENDPIQAMNTKFAENYARVEAIGKLGGEFAEKGLTKVKYKNAEIEFSDFRSQAITAGMSVNEFELVCRRSDYPAMPNTPAIHIQNQNIDNDAMVASIMRANGVVESARNEKTGTEYGLKHMFKEQVLEASHQRQYQMKNSITNLFDAQIKAGGENYYSSDRDTPEFTATAIKAWEKVRNRPVAPTNLNASGFSTLNLTYVLENAMYKTALASFIAGEGIWRQITKVHTLKDFKDYNFYRLDMNGAYKKVATDGELKHVSLVDTKYTMNAETYGAMITIDRKTRKNDDMGVVLTQASDLGLLGVQRIEEALMVLLLSNPSSFFAVGNKNYATGGGSALSLTSLETARAAFRNQVVNGKPVNVAPKMILTGTALEITANKIYGEANYHVPTGSAGQVFFPRNEFYNTYKPVVSPYINNTSVLDQDGAAITGQSATKWYLFADPNIPQGAALNIGFIDGKQTPYFDSAETQFNIPGGIQFRSYHDWGVKMMVTQLAYLADGA